MQRLIAPLIAVFAALSVSGCAAALVGGLFYNSSKTYEQKQRFTQEFQAHNIEREKAGLVPLDWCSEAYKFDKVWAAEGRGCAGRIKAYEGGDAAALKL